jgi:DNA-binding MarR family transcriptional regulator
MAQLPFQQSELFAWRGLLRFHAKVTGEMSARLQSEVGLTLPEYELLSHLYEHPSERMPMSELARLVLLTPSGITRMVDRLVSRGMVERQSVRSDARVQHAVLTPEGREVFLRAGRVHADDVRGRFTDHLTEDQVEELGRVWSKLLNDDKSSN